MANKMRTIRVSDEMWAQWVKAAGGRDVSGWIRSVCDRAAESLATPAVVEPASEPDTAHVKVRQPKVSPPSAVLPREKPQQTADQKAANVSALKDFLASR